MAEAGGAAPERLVKRTESADAAAAAESVWAAAGERLRGANISERYLEQKERELQSCIEQNYARIQGVEKELQGLQLQLRLTSGPKKSALELMRRKIEAQNERVLAARQASVSAAKVAALAAERLAEEERAKEQLCQELNLLVQQSAHAQLEKMETLMRRLEALSSTGASSSAPTSVSDELQQHIKDLAAGEAASATAADAVVATHAPAAAAAEQQPPATAQADGREGAPEGKENAASTAGGASGEPQQAAAAEAQRKARQQAAAAARARHVNPGQQRQPGSRKSMPSSRMERSASPQLAARPSGRVFQGFDN